MNFPTSLDTLLNPSDITTMEAVGYEHDIQHSDLNDAVEALEAKVGINGSAVTTSLDYLVSNSLLKLDQTTPQPITGGLLVGASAFPADEFDGIFILTPTVTAHVGRGMKIESHYGGTYASTGFESATYCHGVSNQDHMYGAQLWMWGEGTGTVARVASCMASATIDSGTWSSYYGFYYNGKTVNAPGVITAAWSFYTGSPDPAYFSGKVAFSSTALTLAQIPYPVYCYNAFTSGAGGLTTAQLGVFSSTATAIGVGGVIALGGKSGLATDPYPYAYILGASEASASTYAGYFAIYTTSGGAGSETNSANYERLRVTSTGNVGIGATDPLAKLTIGAYGSSVAVGATGFLFGALANVDAVAGIECKNSHAGTSADIRFAMVCTDGNYTSFAMPGLGNTVTAIFGITRATGSFLFNANAGTPRHIGIGTLGATNLVFGTTNAARMTILAAGNIGIGTIAPAASLDILNGTGSDTPGTNPILGIMASATQGFAFRYNAAVSVISIDRLYSTAWYSCLSIDRTTGYVGVGIATPGMPLQLNRNGCTTNNTWNCMYFVAVKTTDMGDGFGTGFRFRIQDDAGVENSICGMLAARDGADNSGKMSFQVYNAGTIVTSLYIDHLGNVNLGAANTNIITCTGRLVVRTAASDPQHATPASRPAGSVGEIAYYTGKLYFCIDATTPAWEKITSA